MITLGFVEWIAQKWNRDKLCTVEQVKKFYPFFFFYFFFQEVTKVTFPFALATAPCQSKASAKPEISTQEFTQLQQQLQDMKEQVRMVWFSSFFWWLLIASLRFSRYISGGSRPSDKRGWPFIQTLTKGGGSLQETFFRPFRPQFGLKIRGDPGPPSPGSATVYSSMYCRPYS